MWVTSFPLLINSKNFKLLPVLVLCCLLFAQMGLDPLWAQSEAICLQSVIVTIYSFVPEPKGLTLEELDESFEKSISNLWQEGINKMRKRREYSPEE